MTKSDNGNLLGGEYRPSRGAGRFEARAALAPRGVVGVWPCSDLRDAEPARAHCLAGAEAWAAVPFADRRAIVTAAAGRLEEAAPGDVAALLGLDQEELFEHRRGLVPRTRGLARDLRAGATPGIGLVMPHWSELFAGVFLPVAAELLRGRAVILLADPRLPVCADLAADALLEVGLPVDALAVLHGVNAETRDWLIAAGTQSVTAAGTRGRIAELRRRCEQARIPEPRLTTLRSAAWEVPADGSVEDAARKVLEMAFGRAETLFGQRAGQVGRVFCPERRLSAFTAALLAGLEERRRDSDLLPLIDRAMVARTRAAWARGLDRGAALIWGGRAPAGEEGRSGTRRLLPTVFTNVETAMQDSTAPEPLPVLHLHRLPSRPRKGRSSGV